MNDLEKFYEFLDKNHPGYGECMVCKCVLPTKEGSSNEEQNKIYYFCIEKHKLSEKMDNYTINWRLWYDFLYFWKGDNWEIIYKSK